MAASANKATSGRNERYVWLGRVWQIVLPLAQDPEEDEVVSDDGEVRPIGDLMGALFRGEALEQGDEFAAHDEAAALFQQALGKGLIERNGEHYVFAGSLLGRGFDRAIAHVISHPDIIATLRQAVAAGRSPRFEVVARTATPSPPVPSATALAQPKTGEIDVAGKARAQVRIDEAAKLGLKLPSSKADGLFYDLGTLVDDGVWASERKIFEELPTGDVALPLVRDAIRAEDRQDHTFDAWDLRMSKTTGKLGDPKRPETHAWTASRRGLQGYTARAGIGAIPEHWRTHTKAAAVNENNRDNAAERPRQLLVDDRDPVVVLRVQKARGRIFACVSPTYSAFDGDLVLEALLAAQPRGSRVNIDYDPDMARGRVEIVTLQEERPVVGEPFRTSFTIGWDDTGGGSVWGDGGLFSARCLNLTRIFSKIGTFRIRHAGGVEKLARRFRGEFDRIARVVSQLSKAYGHAAEEPLTNAERIESAQFLEGIYRSLLQRELVPVRGRREEAVKSLAAQALADENGAGLTRAGIVNGLTRYAHRVNDDPWHRDEIERAAGHILWSSKQPIKLDYLAKEAV